MQDQNKIHLITKITNSIMQLTLHSKRKIYLRKILHVSILHIKIKTHWKY